MHEIEIAVKERDIFITYPKESGGLRKIVWHDKANISKKFLLKLDKINKCSKHRIDCFFSQKSDFYYKPKLIVLERLGGESTTWRIVLVTLRALKWAGKIDLKIKHSTN